MAERFGRLELVERDPDRLVLCTPRASLGRWCLFYLLSPSIFIAIGLLLFLREKPWALLSAGVALLVTVLPNLSSLTSKRVVVDRATQTVTLTRTFLLLRRVLHVPFEEITGFRLQYDIFRGLKTRHIWRVFLDTAGQSAHVDTGTSYHGMHALVAEISQLTGKPVVSQRGNPGRGCGQPWQRDDPP